MMSINEEKTENRYQRGLKKNELEHGAYYKGKCRNASVARWNALENCFYHWRTKFMDTFIEEISHYEDEDRYDVFIVFEKIDTPEKVIPFKDGK